MSGLDKLAACFVMTIWGLNFTAIKLGVGDMPPLLLGAMRFLFLVFPAIFFVARPKVPLWPLLAYALTISFGQFAFLFSAIAAGMPAGLASLVLQTQAFIAPAIAALVLAERLKRSTVIGLSIAFAGLVMLTLASRGNASVPMLGFGLTILAALSWAVGNIISKRLAQTEPMGLVVWSGLIPVPVFLAASVMLEGLPRIELALSHLTWRSVATVLYLSYGASLVGYGIWTVLVTRYPVQIVAPFTLLIPIIGIVASWAILGEALSAWQVAGCAVVIAGLLVNVLGLPERRA